MARPGGRDCGTGRRGRDLDLSARSGESGGGARSPYSKSVEQSRRKVAQSGGGMGDCRCHSGLLDRRVAEVFIYPLLTGLVGLPAYESADWVRVSRHKFSGLVGHDLIWCLYCDWMTGVWSLGSEMLRNVESFWCPIRFDSSKKCANCQIDFPDIAGGWVPADGTMAQVADKVKEMYGAGERSWFGRRVHVTISRKQMEPVVK